MLLLLQDVYYIDEVEHGLVVVPRYCSGCVYAFGALVFVALSQDS